MTDTIYTSDLSPFGARLRIAVALKGLSYRFERPPGGSGSPELKTITPFGRIPVLLRGDAVLVESLALLDYLEDAHPQARRLQPADAAGRARVRMIQLLFDHNVLKAMNGVFVQLTKPAPDASAARLALDAVTEELAKLVRYFDAAAPAVGEEWSTADCAMAPFAHLMDASAQAFQSITPTERIPRFHRWWSGFSTVPEVSGVIAQMRSAMTAMRNARQAGAAAAGRA